MQVVLKEEMSSCGAVLLLCLRTKWACIGILQGALINNPGDHLNYFQHMREVEGKIVEYEVKTN
jgi:hypothetical protein